jgi:uncharacterized protein (TIGR04255 family)
MNGHRQYRHPPIQEAVCELHFGTSAPLSKEQIESMRQVWAKDYPNQQLVEEKNIQLVIDASKAELDPKSQTIGHRLVCRSADNIKLVQLSSRFMAINHLKPYPGWHLAFRQMILDRFSEVQNQLGCAVIGRLLLRYINRLDFPEYPLTWDQWFNLKLPVPPVINRGGGLFQMHYRQPLPDGVYCFVNIVTMEPAPEGHTSVLLDITVSLEKMLDSSAIGEPLEAIRDLERAVFEDYLTVKAKNLFEPLPS